MLERLRELRNENNYTVYFMAQKLGISTGGYSLIENGKRGLSYSTALQIAKIFNLEPDDIFLPKDFTKSKV